MSGDSLRYGKRGEAPHDRSIPTKEELTMENVDMGRTLNTLLVQQEGEGV